MGVDGTDPADGHFDIPPGQASVVQLPGPQPPKRFDGVGIARIGPSLSLIEEGEVPGEEVGVAFGGCDDDRDVVEIGLGHGGQVGVRTVEESLGNVLPPEGGLLLELRVG